MRRGSVKIWGGNPYQTGPGYYAGGPYYGGLFRAQGGLLLLSGAGYFVTAADTAAVRISVLSRPIQKR
jgi:hypothetical protein